MGEIPERIPPPRLGQHPGFRTLYGAGARAADGLPRLSPAGDKGGAVHHRRDDKQLRPQQVYAGAAQEEVLPRAYRLSYHDMHPQAEPQHRDSAEGYSRRHLRAQIFDYFPEKITQISKRLFYPFFHGRHYVSSVHLDLLY